jgi:hypothetical protein
MKSDGHILFARVFLLHCARIGRIAWREYNVLMKGVLECEHRSMGCEGKEQLSFELARQVQRRNRKTERGGCRKFYRCRVCGYWHLASTLPQKADLRRQRVEEMREEELSRA